MLDDAVIEQILKGTLKLTIGVLGDLFLDRYLDIDARLTEPSIETGLDAYQVTRVRSYPGAAGTVINNLVRLGVKAVVPLAIIGDDGEGHELRQALGTLKVVSDRGICVDPKRRTPTYTKPMLTSPGQPARELNRLDIKNHEPFSQAPMKRLLSLLPDIWKQMDALIVLDQVSEANCGVVTDQVRDLISELGRAQPDKLILADSRERVGLFRNAWLKPNATECRKAVGTGTPGDLPIGSAARLLAERTGRPVFCTCGERGIVLADSRPGHETIETVPGYPVSGPIDVVGAGDSTSAGIACAVASGASLAAAAAFGNLVASITIQQLGTTGTASPEQVRRRWQEVTHNAQLSR
jgi:rfaE bifunctional protein kinase chain/domain